MKHERKDIEPKHGQRGNKIDTTEMRITVTMQEFVYCSNSSRCGFGSGIETGGGDMRSATGRTKIQPNENDDLILNINAQNYARIIEKLNPCPSRWLRKKHRLPLNTGRISANGSGKE